MLSYDFQIFFPLLSWVLKTFIWLSNRRGRIENITYGYIIAKPEIRNSNSHRRICFVYTNINSTYSWTVGKTECLKLIQPGHQGYI